MPFPFAKKIWDWNGVLKKLCLIFLYFVLVFKYLYCENKKTKKVATFPLQRLIIYFLLNEQQSQ